MPNLPTINDSSARSWIQNLASKGMGADRIYREIRQFYNLGLGQRSPISRRFVRQEAVPLRRQVLQQRASFPKRSDAILDSRRSIKINFQSPLGNRFQINFEFTVRNPLTGQTQRIVNTIGSPDPITLGEARSIARGRLERLANKDFLFDSENLARIQREDFIPDLDSIKILNVFESI